MKHSLIRNFIFIMICIASSHAIQAQLNVKVGYVPAFGSFDGINEVFRGYNEANADIIETPFGELKFIHGIDVGLRYKMGNIAFELDWSNLNRERDVLLYFSQSDSFNSRLYKVGINSFSFGIDGYFDRIGLGASILSQKLNIKREIGSNKLSLVSDHNLALDVHLNLKIQSGKFVSILLKPFYRYSLSDYDLNTFSQDLLGEDANSAGLSFYGVSLVFYNGVQ